MNAPASPLRESRHTFAKRGLVMKTVEIPRDTWEQRLEEFTQSHESWLVSLEVQNPEIGAQLEIDNMPLMGVSGDPADQGGTVAVSVARSAAEHITHVIRGVKHVFVEQTDEGADVALQIQSSDDTAAILRFRVPALPETVDGVVGS
jgi:hypothetical protein